MEGFLVLVYVIMFVWGVLNIVLFFKIWGMTNDVKQIKDYIVNNKSSVPSTHSISAQEIKTDEPIMKDEPIVKDYSEIKKGSVVYSKKDNKKYTVVNVSPNGRLLLDEGKDKSNYDVLSIDEVFIK